MIRFLITILFLLGTQQLVFSFVPEVNNKFGSPTMEELGMTEYSPEPDAKAVVLLDKREVLVDYGATGFNLTTKYIFRIKILDESMTHLGDVAIPYHSFDGRSAITNISAYSYNLINGKIEKNSLDKNLIFHEKVSDNFYLCKFSIPKVIVGSVLEYRFQRTTGVSFENWVVQREIPVHRGEFFMAIPEYFTLNTETSGYGTINVKKEPTKCNFNVNGKLIESMGTKIEAEVDQMPSIKDDDFVYCVNDYCAMLVFELAGFYLPGSNYHSIASSWSDVCGNFIKIWDEKLNLKNPYKAEMHNIDFSYCKNTLDSVNRCAEFLSKHIRWNGIYDINCKDFKESVLRESGSNSTMNFLLISMLKDLGIQCHPLVIRTRDYGNLLRIKNPSLSSFNTMIVQFIDSFGNSHYIDCSDNIYGVDVLPENMIVNAAISIDTSSGTFSMTSTNRKLSTERKKIDIRIEDNKAVCNADIGLTRQHAANFQKHYNEINDSIKFVTEISNKFEIDISHLDIEGLHPRSDNIRIRTSFSCDITHTDSVIYLTPMLIESVSKNPFISETRDKPVEFPFIDGTTTVFTIHIPDGYELDSSTHPLSIKNATGDLSFDYNVSISDNLVMIVAKYKNMRDLYAQTEYSDLRYIFDLMADKCSDIIVLKKKNISL